MVDLIAKTPCADLLPQSIGQITLNKVTYPGLWSVAPFAGQQKATGTALGHPLPKPGRTVTQDGLRLIWAGHGVVFAVAPNLPDLSALAAVTDQSDGWAVVTVSGSTVVDVLARLVPIDLRPATFKTGHTARTLLGHMTASVTRTGPQTFEVMVMRSMAATLVHDLTRAAALFAARD